MRSVKRIRCVAGPGFDCKRRMTLTLHEWTDVVYYLLACATRKTVFAMRYVVNSLRTNYTAKSIANSWPTVMLPLVKTVCVHSMFHSSSSCIARELPPSMSFDVHNCYLYWAN